MKLTHFLLQLFLSYVPLSLPPPPSNKGLHFLLAGEKVITNQQFLKVKVKASLLTGPLHIICASILTLTTSH